MIIWTKRVFLLSVAVFFCGIYFVYGGRIIFSIPSLPREVVLSFNKIGEFLLMLTGVLFIFLISLRTDKKWKMICSNFLYFFVDLFIDDVTEEKNRDVEIIERIDFFLRFLIVFLGFFFTAYIIGHIPIPEIANHQRFNLFFKSFVVVYLFPIIWGSVSLAGLYLKELIQRIPQLI